MSSTPTLLRIKAVCEQVGFSRSHVYRLIKANQFPKPIKVSSRVAVWHSSIVEQWINQQGHINPQEEN